jgi:hypothetical protein
MPNFIVSRPEQNRYDSDYNTLKRVQEGLERRLKLLEQRRNGGTAQSSGASVGAAGLVRGGGVSGGGGSVGLSSVGLALPPGLLGSVNNPLTGSGGTITLSLLSQSANTFFAGPATSAGIPEFRPLETDDLPDGIVTPAKLDAGSGMASSATFYRGDGVWATPAGGSGGYQTQWCVLAQKARANASSTPTIAREFMDDIHLRTRMDLTDLRTARLVTTLTTIGGDDGTGHNPMLLAQYSTDNGSTWTDLGCGVSLGTLVGSDNTRASGWKAIPSGAQADVLLRLITLDGDAAVGHEFGNTCVQFRTSTAETVAAVDYLPTEEPTELPE